jgi:hypothetical protein
MNIELNKQLIKAHQLPSLQEIFKNELDNPENIDEEYYAPFIEDDPSKEEYFGDTLEEYEKSLSPDELLDRYYSEIFSRIYDSEFTLEKIKANINEDGKRDFKVWFRAQFVYDYEIKEDDHKKYTWTDDFTIMLINLSLRYLDNEYVLYKDGGCSPEWDRLELFLRSVANQPFEAELFKLIEDDWGIFEDED